MAKGYSLQTVKELQAAFDQADVLRPMRIERYEDGDELEYDVTGVAPSHPGRVKLRIERFVGGGFAGQVYRVKVLELECPDGDIAGLTVGGAYAVKILLPPSSFSERFRNAIYAIGFQGPFSLQVNPDAARAGALWQKFIRRAAGIRLGTSRAVTDILATFVDRRMGSCGEISEWIEGRNWRFEVDDNLTERKRWRPGDPDDALSSPEYRAKRTFMKDLVDLLHELGAPELARQYEWSTCKSQPNVLKRLDCEDDPDPAAGLTAVDFRAGLALLPLLPMSPGDFRLIFRGLIHGRLVQFDRGDLDKLERFVDAHAETFADMRDSLAELRRCDAAYRESLPDVTHHHVRLLCSPRLWRGLIGSARTGWEVRGLVDDRSAATLRKSTLATLIFGLLGLVQALAPLAAITLAMAHWIPPGFWAYPAWFFAACSLLVPPLMPLVAATLAAAGWAFGALSPPVAVTVLCLALIAPKAAKLLRRVWGRGDYRRHYGRMLVSPSYALHAVRARIAELLIRWHRAGRVGEKRALLLMRRPWRLIFHAPFAVLPAGIHRAVTDWGFFLDRLHYIVVRPVRLYFNAPMREQWLRDMLAEGRRKHMLSEDDARLIEKRMDEPFIQKYLKSLAVHVCTLPITQIVSVAIATIYYFLNRDDPNAWAKGLGIIALFQITPISPGSLARGLYTLQLVIRERNFKDYNIAVFMSFFKYIGYLAFPIQMAYRYPALARFMAGHWSTEAVHVVPVFGEHGALLEHGVFDLFYNRPLTIRRSMRLRQEARAGRRARSWHVLPCVLVAAAVLIALKAAYLEWAGYVPGLDRIWWIAFFPPMLAGAAIAVWAGGMSLGGRIALSVAGGLAVAMVDGGVHLWMDHVYTFAKPWPPEITAKVVWDSSAVVLWRVLYFTLAATIGALIAETRPFKSQPGEARVER